jgi:hypothetical protein
VEILLYPDAVGKPCMFYAVAIPHSVTGTETNDGHCDEPSKNPFSHEMSDFLYNGKVRALLLRQVISISIHPVLFLSG